MRETARFIRLPYVIQLCSMLMINNGLIPAQDSLEFIQFQR